MGLLDRIAQRFGYTKVDERQPDVRQTPIGALAAGQTWGPQPQAYDVEDQQTLYRTLSWIYVAVSHVAEQAAGQDFDVLQVKGEERIDVPNHPFEMLLSRPNELQSRFEFLVATFSYYSLTGNAYWWLNRTDERRPPSEMWVIPSNMMTPVPDGRLYIKGYEYKPGGLARPEFIPASEVVHFKRFNPSSPFVGASPIEALAVIAAGDLAMQKWNTNYFGRDNAKVPGALAFADSIRPNDWETLKTDIKEQWGGTHRSGPLMLRNVGAGGVQWLQMTLSQQDMQFLEGRKFNKEEIFSAFAPGLASVLDVNATEANAKSGRATLMEYGVWPLLVSVAEKVSNNLLPVYGPGLIGEFDDPRVTDTALELNQIAAYERTHTVDEVRSEWYNEEALDDERGSLFVAEIAKAPPAFGAAPAAAAPAKSSLLSPEQLAELARWQRKAVKAVSSGKHLSTLRFVSELLPSELQLAVSQGLKSAATLEQIDALFAAARAHKWELPARAESELGALSKQLELAVAALSAAEVAHAD